MMLVNNMRVLSQSPHFLMGLLDGILVKNIKSFIDFSLRFTPFDLAASLDIFGVFAWLSDLLDYFRNRIEKILMMYEIVVIFDADCALLLHLGYHIFGGLINSLIPVAEDWALFL